MADVLSPATRCRDCLDHRDLCEEHGVKEDWLIDPGAWPVEALFLERGEDQLVGRWPPEGQTASRFLKGFKVSVRKLFGCVVSVKGEDCPVHQTGAKPFFVEFQEPLYESERKLISSTDRISPPQQPDS